MIKHCVMTALAIGLMTGSSLSWAHDDDHPEAVISEDLEDGQTKPPTLAVVLWGSSGVAFQGVKFGVSMHLRVTGPDYVYDKTYDNRDPVFSAREDSGQLLPDGVYRYELREVLEMDEEMEEALSTLSYAEQQTQKRQWRREGRWPLPRPKTQNAVFRIENGAVMAPD